MQRGEVVALLGRNGAGKTTTLSSIMGLVRPRAGTIRFDSKEIQGREPFEACRAGLGFVPENCRLFGGLTVAENFEAARRAPRDGATRWDVDPLPLQSLHCCDEALGRYRPAQALLA